MSIESWEIDCSRSRIQFVVRHLVLSKQDTREQGRDTRRRADGRRPRLAGLDRARFSATAAIARRDFGFTGNAALDSGDLVIGRRIEVEVEVEVVRQPAVRVA